MTSRTQRYEELYSSRPISEESAAIIGVGAIGRQVALQLAAMGIGELTMFDFDEVSIENLGPQGYRPDQIGISKVEATMNDCVAANPDCSIHAVQSAYNGKIELAGSIFCCVDTMKARKMVFKGIHPDFFVDGRMSILNARILAWSKEKPWNYEATLFSDEEALPQRCTFKSTLFTASIAAGFMLSQYTSWLRGGIFPRDVLLNLPAMEAQHLETQEIPEPQPQQEPDPVAA